jgi:hypothetical protein
MKYHDANKNAELEVLFQIFLTSAPDLNLQSIRAVFLGQELRVPIGYEVEWSPEPVCSHCW